MAVKSKSGVKTTDKEYVYCSGCDSDKKVGDFYKSYGATASGILPYCKTCCYKMSINKSDGKIDIDKFKIMLTKVDRPYLHQTFVDNSNKYNTPKSIIGYYFKDIGMPQNRLLKYRDSMFEKGESNVSLENVSEIVATDMVRKWGNGYSVEQIRKLESFSKDMQSSYDVKTASHKDYLHKICKVSLKMDEALDNDNIGEFQKLSNVYDTLMKSAKFTAVQRSAVDDTGGFATFSEFIERLESEGFIEPMKIEENFDIVEATISDIKKYTKQLVLGDSSISTLAQETLLKMQQKDMGDNDESS